MDCPSPPVPTHMTFSHTGTSPGSYATYTCDPGYVHDVSNTVNLTCLATGVWDGPSVTCSPVDCGAPPYMENATATFVDTTYLSTAVYTCDDGLLATSPNATLMCSVDGTWTGDTLDCQPIDCGFPPNISRSFFDHTNITTGYLSQAVYTCHSGRYYTGGGVTLTCTDVNNAAVWDGLYYGRKYCPKLSSYVGCYPATLTPEGTYTRSECRAVCRGLNRAYAALRGDECACLDTIETAATGDENCTMMSSDDGSLYGGEPDLWSVFAAFRMYNREARTCKLLFEEGVHVSGMYYLIGDSSPTMCHFYDGTVCDPYWIGFGGSCYSWDLQYFNYSEAVDFCTLQDSVPVAINSRSESDFIRITHEAIEQFEDEDSWHIGLYDHFGVFARQWDDGSLFTYSGFAEAEPNEMHKKCTALKADNTWEDSPCVQNRTTICERPEGIYGCVSMPYADISAVDTFSDPEFMTLTLCFEVCRAQGAIYSGLAGSTCYCLTSLPPTHSKVPWNECGSPCPGNRYQLCGDPSGGATLTAFVLEDNVQPNAGSCLDLELQGITGPNLTISQGGVVSTANCTPELVIDDDEEMAAIFNDTASMGVFSFRFHWLLLKPEPGLTRWIVGLFKYGSKGLFRTSNGRPLGGMRLPESLDQQYMGCAETSPTDVLVLSDYHELTVLQCVELCRGRGDKFALLGQNPFRCYCSSTHPANTTRRCDKYCYRNTGQLCGGDQYSTVSAYKVDNTSCADVDPIQWMSVGENSTCFKLSNLSYAHTSSVSTCKTIDSSYRPASIRTLGELELLTALYWMLKEAYTPEGFHTGASDQFKMGTFSWADGWLFDPFVWDAYNPFLNYGTQFYVYTDLESLETVRLVNHKLGNEQRRVLCRHVPDYLGCYEKPTTPSPAIENYSSMGVTLCKQRCLAQDKDVALLDTGSCFCLDAADLGSMVSVSESDAGCDVACPANKLQSCGNSGRVRAYSVDNYTSCDAGYIGYRGKCYRFFPQTNRNANSAADFCRRVRGYLATPRDSDEASFLIRVIRGVPSLWNHTKWRIGILDPMDGDYQASSDGSIMRSEMWNGTRNSENTQCSSLDTQTGTWTKSACGQTLPFVCETSPVFLGCRDFTSSPTVTATFDLTLTSSSAQQCVALCYGQNTRYALLTQTKCSCMTYDALQGSSHTVVNCPAQCGDYFSQLCGKIGPFTYAVHDIDAYSYEDKTAWSCPEYRDYLVTARGHYPLYMDGISTMRTQCGYLGPKHDDILQTDAAAVAYTSSTNAANAHLARLNPEKIWWTSWKPVDTDLTPWLQISLSDYFLVKAISMTGKEGAAQSGHVTSFDVSEGLVSTSLTFYNGSLQGPPTRTALATRFLSAPFVAKVVRIHPTSWNVKAIMAVGLLGQRYKDFSYDDRYMGCFADPWHTLFESNHTATTFEACKDHCLGQRYPFFGLYVSSSGSDVCACAMAVGDYGILGDDSCNVTCLAMRCGNDVTNSVAVYRAYHKQCVDPPEVANTTRSEAYLVTPPAGVFNFGTTVTYTCITGHEFPDLTTVASITCLQNNTWSYLPHTGCQLVECPVPVQVPNSHMSSNGNLYGALTVHKCHNHFETATGATFVLSHCAANKV
ncbi:hypothetical protein BaRGS_00021319, partial [Batillaria attramentaria]